MLLSRIFIIFLFIISIGAAVCSWHTFSFDLQYVKTLCVYLFFSLLYYHLRFVSHLGTKTIEYGMNYNLSFVIATTPSGLLFFELIYRFLIYLYKGSRQHFIENIR
ncbi:polyferredoxin [Brevibacillus fulvus]|uniref:Polyferredoxin n=1 Tax=Brevibacillus fulvus TaxID=1125967 RepID=A0A938XYU5_9BACL|nr:polyferredoxin [Brevibacillus fulvus]